MPDEPIESSEPAMVVVVEDISGTVPAEEVVIEQEAPRDELDLGYQFGTMKARMDELEQKYVAMIERQAAFEAATAAAVEAEAEELIRQSEVLDDVAEEVLPPDHPAAEAHNPEHSLKKTSWWESLVGGHPQSHRGKGGGTR